MITDLLTNVGVIKEAMKFVMDKKRILESKKSKAEEQPLNEEPEPKTVNKVF